MFSKTFLLDTGERAVKTFAQSLLGALTVHVAGATFHQELMAAGVAALVSVLSSVGGGNNGSASLVPSVRSGAPGKHESA